MTRARGTYLAATPRLPAGLPPGSQERIAMNFDAGFVTRLKQRDPDTCTFLVSSLTPALEARLRYKLRDHDAIEDIRNETFYRVFCLVDGGRVREPEQLGAFVRGVCDRVALETRRKAHATESLPWNPAARPTPQNPCPASAWNRPTASPISINSWWTKSADPRSEEHTSELQSPCNLVCR